MLFWGPNLFALGWDQRPKIQIFPIYQDHQLETRGLSESFSAFKLPVVSRHYLSIVLSIQYPAKDTTPFSGGKVDYA
jgi:hypothetical protein